MLQARPPPPPLPDPAVAAPASSASLTSDSPVCTGPATARIGATVGGALAGRASLRCVGLGGVGRFFAGGSGDLAFGSGLGSGGGGGGSGGGGVYSWTVMGRVSAFIGGSGCSPARAARPSPRAGRAPPPRSRGRRPALM